MAELVIVAGPGEGRAFALGERSVIGRQAGCDLQLADNTVSRHHAVIVEEKGEYYVEDLGSSNGTYVNGHEVRRARLRHGDTIKLSHAVLAFRDEPTHHTSVAVVPTETRHSAVVDPEDAVASLMREGTAIESVDQLQDIHRKLITMARFSEAIRSTFDLATLLDRMLALLFDIFPQAERGFVMLRDESGALVTAASKSALPGDIRVSKGILDGVVEKRHAILSNSPAFDPRLGKGESIVASGMQSIMAAPLIYADDVLGVLHLDTTRRNAPFNEDDLALFGGLAAASAAVAIANARLHEGLLRRQRLEQELSLAQTVQRSFLPERMPEREGLELAYHYALAYQVGGDFYDVLELADGRVAVTIGDVSGKGIPAALLMAKTISEMRVAAAARSEPSATLSMVNRMMLGSVSPEMFVTAAAVFYDPRTGAAVASDAGHMPPIIKRASGKAEFLDLEKGFPLGVVDDGLFRDKSVALAPGDTFLLYTDGVTDASNGDGATFGPDRLIAAVEAAPPGARSVIDAVLSSVGDFVRLTRPFDDLTMVALSPRA